MPIRFRKLPERAYLLECFDYCAETGRLTWKRRTQRHFSSPRVTSIFNTRYAGTEAGAVNREGRRIITIANTVYCANRIVWVMHHGDIPEGYQIDHINGDTLDDRIENMRLATHTQNLQNLFRCTRNTSGHRGVYWRIDAKKWQAYATLNKRRVSLGLFDDKEQAAVAARQYRLEHFGEFAGALRYQNEEV